MAIRVTAAGTMADTMEGTTVGMTAEATEGTMGTVMGDRMGVRDMMVRTADLPGPTVDPIAETTKAPVTVVPMTTEIAGRGEPQRAKSDSLNGLHSRAPAVIT
jgi:hypothetical protein